MGVGVRPRGSSMDASRSFRSVWTAAIVLTAGAAMLAVAPAAHAADKVPELRVSYADLDLSTPEGITLLYVRVRDAARRVCEPLRLRTGTRMTDRFDACVREAIGATGRRLKAPALMALYAGEMRQQSIGAPRRADAPRAWVLM